MPEDRLVSGNSSKAGLPSFLSEINSRIIEASKDSRFTAAQDRKAVELEEKIKKQLEQLNQKLQQSGLVKRAGKLVDELVEEYEKEQVKEFERWREFCWVCVDMDAFYASVECLDSPELRNVPMAVGDKAMLSTANYEARKFGVSAAMPGYIALKLCPELKIVPLRFDRYREMSGRVAEILKKYDGNMMMWSLDEAFLRLNRESCRDVGIEFSDLVQRIRNEVKESTGLTCSAGIAANPLLAKLASNFRKPDGQFEINRKDVKEMRAFLFAQPCIKLSGIGKVTSVTLEKVFGIKSVGDLNEKRHLLPLIFKEKTVKSLLCKSIGHSEPFENEENELLEEEGQKSVSCERTFAAGRVTYEDILMEICENLIGDIESMKISEIGRVGIKLKTADFRVYTRERGALGRLNVQGKNQFDLLKTATSLFDDFTAEHPDSEFRLIGVRLSSLKYERKSMKRPASKTLLEEWLNDDKSVDDKANTDTTAKCPICSKILRDENDLAKVNEHVDECLTKQALKEILRSADFMEKESK